jgi:hypothetical protein
MRLSWNEIRTRAATFARAWQSAHYERGETQTFYNEFFEIFGTPRRRVASFEEPVKKLGNKQGFIDLFWKGVLLVEHKSAGRALAISTGTPSPTTIPRQPTPRHAGAGQHPRLLRTKRTEPCPARHPHYPCPGNATK